MSELPPRTLRTVTGAGGYPGPCELARNGIADDRQHDFTVNGLLPILRARGVVKPGYAGSTLRENLGIAWPARESKPASAWPR